MWDYDAFIGKAQLYFSRAQDGADDESTLWLLLGLEFLLRAPLAKIHPTLLADPQAGGGDSIMQAAGYPMKVNAGPPKSIATHTVIGRLGAIILDFNKDRQNEATTLAGLRNEELHSSESPLVTEQEQWLPHFTRVVDTVCEHLGLDPLDLVGSEIISHGRSLVDAADRKLEHLVLKRINEAKAFFSKLTPQEVSARRSEAARQIVGVPAWKTVIESAVTFWRLLACPACEEPAEVELEAVRTTNERLEEGEIIRDIVYIVKGLKCQVCGLELANTAEIRSAGLRQQYIWHEKESLEDRYENTLEPDYGND
ncbi:hypothetical protein [Streptomyces sp. NPDC055692]|uniref:hypothetical protein n=1 Tax=Streptomyces sp. NPDC055692 TaxID=3155683 RepID=UPI003446A6EB